MGQDRWKVNDPMFGYRYKVIPIDKFLGSLLTTYIYFPDKRF